MGKDFVKILDDEKCFFPIKIELLTALVTFYHQCSEKSPNYITILALNMCVSIIRDDENPEYLPFMLELLKEIINTNSQNVVSQYRLIASSCFINIFKREMEKNRITNYQPLIQPFCTFLCDVQFFDAETFTLLSEFGRFLKDKQSVKMFELFCKNAITTIDVCKDKITPQTSKELMDLSREALESNYSLAVIRFAKKIAQLFGPQNFISFVFVFPGLLIHELSKLEAKTKNSLKNKKEVTVDFKNNPSFKQSYEGTTFNGPVDTSIVPIIKIVDNLADLIDPKMIEVINELMSFVCLHQSLTDGYVANSISLLCEYEETQQYFDFITCILFSFRTIEQFVLQGMGIPIIFRSKLFEPSISFFNQNENFMNIMTLKIETVKYLSKCKADYIIAAIRDISVCPFRYAEFLLIISQPNIFFPFSILLVSQELIQTFARYRTIVCTKENRVAVCQVRIAQLYLLERILEIPTAIDHYMTSSFFLKELFFLLMEKTTRKWAFNFIKKYLDTPSGKVNTALHEGIKQSFTELIAKELDDNNTEYIIDYINFFAEMIKVIKADYVVDLICNKLVDTKSDHCSHLYINSVLLFLFKCPSISKKRFIQVENGIKKIYGTEPPLIVLRWLLRICYGVDDISMREVYVVKNAAAIILILRAFIESKLCFAVIQAVTYLIEDSEENKAIFHDNGIDLVVIDLIKHSKSEVVAQKLLHLLENIAVFKSSVTTVNKFINLFCPYKGKYLPSYQHTALSFFNNMIREASLLPDCGYPITSENIATIGGLPITCMVSSTVVFWFMATKEEGTTTLFTFEDENRTSIIASYENGGLVCAIETETKAWQGPGSLNVPLNKWIQISMSCTTNVKTEHSYISFFIDEDNYQRQIFPIVDLMPGSCKFMIGNVARGNAGSTLPTNTSCCIGPIGIFDLLTAEKVQVVKDTNPHCAPIEPLPYAYLIPSKEDDIISFKMAHGSQNYSLDLLPPKNSNHYSFIDIVSSRVGYTSLVPLYTMLDFTYIDGKKFDDYPVVITNLLRNILSINTKGQKDFLNNGGFQTIAYLLSQSNPENLTYQLYSAFVGIAFLLTEKELLQDLITNVLANFDLWIKSAECEQVFRHWGHSLFVSYPSFVANATCVATILDQLRAYLYYSPCETGLVLAEERNEKLRFGQIRKSLFSAAYSLALTKITNDDIKKLVFQILTSGDKKQQNELLDFMLAIVSISFRSRENSPSYASLLMLHNLIATNDADVIFRMIEIVIMMHKSFVIYEITLEEHLQMIIEELPTTILNESFFSLALSKCEKQPELFSLCCYIADCIGGNSVHRVFTTLKPSSSLTMFKYCCVWASVLYLKSANEEITTFILKCGSSAWVDFFSCLGFIGRCIKPKDEELERKFVKKVADFVLSKINEATDEEIVALFTIIRSYVFTKPYGFDNQLFGKCETKKEDKTEETKEDVVNSPRILMKNVSTIKSIDPQNKMKIAFGKPSTPYNLLLCDLNPISLNQTNAEKLHFCIKNTEKNRRFGIKIVNNKWVDADFAALVLDIYQKRPIEENLLTAMLSASYLLRDNQKVVMRFISTMIPTKEDGCYPQEMDLFNNVSYSTNNPTIGNKSWNETNQTSFEYCSNICSKDPCSTFANDYSAFLASVTKKSLQLSEMTKQGIMSSTILAIKLLPEKAGEKLINIRKAWRNLWRSLTIEGSPWSDAVDFEGRIVVKKRDPTLCAFLCPCKIRCHYKSKSNDQKIHFVSTSPLCDASDETEKSLTTEFHVDEDKSITEFLCEQIMLSKTYNVVVSVSKEGISISRKQESQKFIKFSSITQIVQKTWFFNETALEINTATGSSVFINFKDGKKDVFLQEMKNVVLPKLIRPIQLSSYQDYFNQLNFTQMWTSGRISNFEYLMMLNIFSGRTFNSILQYPVFPWLLSDYSSAEFSPENPKFYRQLGKPIGALNPKRLKKIIDSSDKTTVEWLFNSTYSVPRTVSRLLSKIEPFTSISGEQFKGIEEEYRKCLNDDDNYSELTPEFFYMPEILDGVELPKWAQSPFDFIYKHRKALESNYVSSQLNKWIDLIWGVNQNGSNASASMNQYNPDLYPTKGTLSPTNAVNGQIPKQLFTSFHAQRSVETTMKTKQRQLQLTPNNVYGAFVYANTQHTMHAVTLEPSGRILCTKICAETQDEVSFNKVINELPALLQQNNIVHTLAHVVSGNFVLIGQNRSSAYYVQPFSSTVSKLPLSDSLVSCVAACNSYVAVAQSDSLISIFRAPRFEDDPFITVQASASSIKCISISDTFKFAVCGTKDNSLIFISLTSGNITKILNIGYFNAMSVVITPSWGLVVAFVSGFDNFQAVNKIIVLTPNGEIVKESVIDGSVKCADAFTDTSGFDHVMFVDELKKVYLFEAYYPERKMQMLTTCKDEMISIRAWYSVGSFIIETKTGKAYVLSMPTI